MRNVLITFQINSLTIYSYDCRFHDLFLFYLLTLSSRPPRGAGFAVMRSPDRGDDSGGPCGWCHVTSLASLRQRLGRGGGGGVWCIQVMKQCMF